MKRRPKHCGAFVDSRELFSWYVYKSQLWRFNTEREAPLLAQESLPVFARTNGQIGPLEATVLRRKGFIVENMQASLDYKSGRITEQEMWSIKQRNIGVTVDPVALIPIINKTRPKKGDWVSFGEGKGASQNGYICVVNGSYVGVAKQDGEFEPLETDQFFDHSSKGGRTTWYIMD